MGVVLFNHLLLVAFAEFLLPLLAVVAAPTTPRLAHFPIGTYDGVAWAVLILTEEFVLKLEGNLLQFGLRIFDKEMSLPKNCKLSGRPIGRFWSND